jgi:hypothetical protein
MTEITAGAFDPVPGEEMWTFGAKWVAECAGEFIRYPGFPIRIAWQQEPPPNPYTDQRPIE